jgi:eukaryotic-like serine/threonine-protein kinase
MNMGTTVTAGVDRSRDEKLARLLAEFTEKMQQGATPDIESAARQHPEIAGELRELWAAAQIADVLGKSDRQRPTAPLSEARDPSSSTALPRAFGDYELLEELGRGGMGIVYRARQRNPERVVALKMILHGALASAQELARFRAEAESVARLEGHPHIVSIHEVKECEGQCYFSMKYVEGTTLARLVTRGPVEPREAARYLLTIAQAIHYAHEHGILHRDLKPSNVLIDQQGQPYVTDFGLAKQVESGAGLTPSRSIVGTPSYMAPEQADASRGRPGPASDVYSLGAILYELLTGRPPFQAASYLDTILLLLDQEPVPPRLLNPRVNRELELICLKCLEKQPARRYASAAELAGDLQAFLAGDPVSAGSISVTYFLGRLLGETPHGPVLENWGGLWMIHGLMIFLFCLLTNGLLLAGITSHGTYLSLWTIGLVAWGMIFWSLRRRGGAVTFIERQMAHVWAAGVAGSIGTFIVEWLLGLDVLGLTPMLAVIAGMVFLAMAGMLSGSFYIAAGVLFLAAIPIALLPRYGPVLFGFFAGISFFIYGWHYYRRRRQASVLDPGNSKR